ncbi:MAG: rhodanese-like domain-containing protein [Bacteroidetes bacterium]|nr:rhodanese-like domain-containing protein [Bacteroidota bacterium]MDA0906589.1 rhodanese-like domain-containing protein [Bacteroidota bacterium]
MKEINVDELKKKLDAKEDVFVLDVREQHEYELSNIGAELIPLDQLSERVDEIEQHKLKEVIVMCRSGGRSARACQVLQGEGFENVTNLAGGINAWAREIDPTLPVY